MIRFLPNAFILGALFTLFLPSTSDGGMPELETELVTFFQSALAAPHDGTDMVHRMAAFRTRLKNILGLKDSIDWEFRSLGKEILIVSSPDGRLRVFSWDTHSGGTWHAMAAVAQFIDGTGVRTDDLTIEDAPKTGDYADVIYQAIYPLRSPTKDSTFYLLIGWGTHGSGAHHKIARVLTISIGKLVPVFGVFPTKNGPKDIFVVESSRSDDLTLSYDPEKEILTADETIASPEGNPRTTGRLQKFLWKGGGFILIDAPEGVNPPVTFIFQATRMGKPPLRFTRGDLRVVNESPAPKWFVFPDHGEDKLRPDGIFQAESMWKNTYIVGKGYTGRTKKKQVGKFVELHYLGAYGHSFIAFCLPARSEVLFKSYFIESNQNIDSIELWEVDDLLVNGKTSLARWLPYKVISDKGIIIDGSGAKESDWENLGWKDGKERQDYPKEDVKFIQAIGIRKYLVRFFAN